jgi:hypothetical protein
MTRVKPRHIPEDFYNVFLVLLLVHGPLFQEHPPHLFGLVHSAGQVRS